MLIYPATGLPLKDDICEEHIATSSYHFLYVFEFKIVIRVQSTFDDNT